MSVFARGRASNHNKISLDFRLYESVVRLLEVCAWAKSAGGIERPRIRGEKLGYTTLKLWTYSTMGLVLYVCIVYSCDCTLCTHSLSDIASEFHTHRPTHTRTRVQIHILWLICIGLVCRRVCRVLCISPLRQPAALCATSKHRSDQTVREPHPDPPKNICSHTFAARKHRAKKVLISTEVMVLLFAVSVCTTMSCLCEYGTRVCSNRCANPEMYICSLYLGHKHI